MKTRIVRNLDLRKLAAGAALAAVMTVGGGVSHSQVPLPAITTRVQPVAHFLIDTSGSMGECDGGVVDETTDLTPSPGGGFRFDPQSFSADDGNCDSDASWTSSTWSYDPDGAGPLPAATVKGRNNGTGPRVYRVTRMEALKLAMSKVLDADGNGLIDFSDEEVLRMKISLSTFDNADAVYRTGNLRFVGSSFDSIWAAVKNLVPNGSTPSGPALAGARAKVLKNCYDGINTAASICNLGPGQTNVNGDDIASFAGANCRKYYVIAFTDGEPTQDATNIYRNPVPVAKALYDRTAVFAGEAVPTGSGPQIRTISIAFGADVNVVGDYRRGVMNCMGFHGATAGDLAADADKDGDGMWNTMDADAIPGGSTLVTCPAVLGFPPAGTATTSYTGTQAGFGNSYFATDAKELQNTFKKIINAIQAGTFSRSDPTLNTSNSVTTSYVYAASFQVLSTRLDWQGHLQRFLYYSADPDGPGPYVAGYGDCNTGVSPPAGAVPVPCWDAGSKLNTRMYSTRVVYGVNPTDYGTAAPAKLRYNHIILAEAAGGQASTGWLGSDGNVPPTYMTVKNMVPSLTGSITAVPAPGTDLYRWSAMATLFDAAETFRPNDPAGTIPATAHSASVMALAFAVGRPDAKYSDGITMRCGAAACPAAANVWKLGDSYNSRPVVVGPPIALVSDPDYSNEYRTRPLSAAARAANPPSALEGFDPNGPYAGADAPLVGGIPAKPCPASVPDAECTVEKRRTVVYLPANDGAIHALDDETGEELWAFVPPGHFPRLFQARGGRSTYIDGLPVVRDVKFPCERAAGGACKAYGSTNHEPFEDGKWHTILLMPQGTGGNFLFALDITNPVAPVFLWEYRNPSYMGLTVAAPTIGEIPSGTSGYTNAAEPGSVVFATGGYFGSANNEPYFHTLQTFSGKRLHYAKFSATRDANDLAFDETRPPGIVNGHTGTPRAIDGNLDGDIDRVYFGDREGRMWKVCDIQENGVFQVKHFFDPARYDQTVTISGQTYIGQPASLIAPTTGLADKNARKQLRGPIFFQPDVTRNQAGNLIVAFGSGNLQDPLSPPNDYKNFVWGVVDDPANALLNGGYACGQARSNAGTSATALFGTVPVNYNVGAATAPPTSSCPCRVENWDDIEVDDPDQCDGEVFPNLPNCRDANNSGELSSTVGECACSAFTALQAARGVPPCVDLRDLSVGVIEKRECTGGVLPTCAVAPACCDMDGSGKIDRTNNTGVNECPNGFEAPPPPPGTPTPAPSLATFSNLVPLNDLLSSAPFIYNKLLLYTEFEPDPDGQVCTDDYKSRVYNLNTFTLGDPFAGGGVAAVGVMGAPYKEYLNTLVTGIDINPSSGAIFVQTSTPGNNPPAALAAPSLAINPAFAGWKQK